MPAALGHGKMSRRILLPRLKREEGFFPSISGDADEKKASSRTMNTMAKTNDGSTSVPSAPL